MISLTACLLLEEMQVYLQTSTITIILPAALYDCGTWYQSEGKYALSMFEDRVDGEEDTWTSQTGGIRLMKRRTVGMVRHVAPTGDEKYIQNFSMET